MGKKIAGFVLVCAALLSACDMTAPLSTMPPEETLGDTELDDGTSPQMEESATGALLKRLGANDIVDIGDPAAPLTLVHFTEHHCGYCRDFHSEHFSRLKSDFIDLGLLRYQVIPFPLKKYSNSALAARATACAVQQGQGMGMHASILEHGESDRSSLRTYAEELTLDEDAFNTCLDAPETDQVLAEQATLAADLAVSVVPTFFLNGEKFVGLPYYPDLEGRIRQALAKAR